MGFDVVHINLHKTFTTPHGGGGPGSGPVGVKQALLPFLPLPVVLKEGNAFKLDFDRPESIGKVSSFYGNFGMVIRALIYAKMLGAEGMRRTSEMAVLNANYIAAKLDSHYDRPKKCTTHARNGILGIATKKGERDHRNRHRQTADRLRRPSAHDLLSPAQCRARNHAHRTDRNRKPRTGQRLYRSHDSNCKRSRRKPRPAQRSPPRNARAKTGRSNRRTKTHPALEIVKHHTQRQVLSCPFNSQKNTSPITTRSATQSSRISYPHPYSQICAASPIKPEK